MPHPATAVQETGGTIAPHLRRLLEFVEPHTGDVCLDVARGRGPMPAALGPHVRHVTAVDATPVAAASAPARPGRMETVEFGTGPVRITGGARGPDGARDAHDDGGRARPRDPAAMTREDPRPRPPRPAPRDPVKADATALPYRDNTFSLVTARFSLYNLGDPGHVLRELLRVCRPGGGRVVIADLVRGNLAGPERDRIERLRDPDHPGTPSIARLTEMITSVGAASGGWTCSPWSAPSSRGSPGPATTPRPTASARPCSTRWTAVPAPAPSLASSAANSGSPSPGRTSPPNRSPSAQSRFSQRGADP